MILYNIILLYISYYILFYTPILDILNVSDMEI